MKLLPILLSFPLLGQTVQPNPMAGVVQATKLQLTATKLPASAHKAVIGVIVPGASLYEGEACVPASYGGPVAVSQATIRQALVESKLGVLSLATAQASANRGRSKKARVAIALVTYLPPLATAALGLGAVGSINLSSKAVAAIATGSWVSTQVTDLLRPQVENVNAALPGMWLDSLPELVLPPGRCTPLLRWMSLYSSGGTVPTTLALSVQ